MESAAVPPPNVESPTPSSSGGAHRPARALVGFMAPDVAAAALVGNRLNEPVPIDALAKVRAARDAVSHRPPGVDQTELATPAPAALDAHVAVLRAQPATACYFNEGYEVKLVDLSRVCALQPHVFTDATDDRAMPTSPTDLTALAELTLPIPKPAELPAQFDQVRQTWLIASSNPNLKITGHFGGQVQAGAVGFGFTVAVLPSLVHVASVHGRHVLRDGYHRAVALLRRGISVIPALVRELGSFEQLGWTPGMLSQDEFLGERPPVLPDYLDDSVSADVALPAQQKLLVIQGLELSPLG